MHKVLINLGSMIKHSLIATFLLNLSQLVNPLLSLKRSPKYHTSLRPIVRVTRSNRFLPVDFAWGRMRGRTSNKCNHNSDSNYTPVRWTIIPSIHTCTYITIKLSCIITHYPKCGTSLLRSNNTFCIISYINLKLQYSIQCCDLHIESFLVHFQLEWWSRSEWKHTSTVFVLLVDYSRGNYSKLSYNTDIIWSVVYQ